MSLFGSARCFFLGTQEELHALNKLFRGYLDPEKSILLLGKAVGGIDSYATRIALLIFRDGIYKLIISNIGPRQQKLSQERRNILSITSLEGLEQKRTNIIIVALIITAFKPMISYQVQSISELLQFCGCVLMLAFRDRLVEKPQRVLEDLENHQKIKLHHQNSIPRV